MNNHFKKTALLSALLLELTTGAQAATITVDGNTCSFPDAVTAANTDTAVAGCNAGSGADVIELTAPVTQVSSGALITSDITINGNNTTLESDGGDFTILHVDNGNLTVNNTTIQGGYNSFNSGAGVHVGEGTLHINQCTLTNNAGGAVLFLPYTSGSISQSNITGNNGVFSYFYSGGVSIVGASVTIEDSTISNNSSTSSYSGGGLYLTNLANPLYVSVSNTTISGNNSTVRGGGISHQDYGNGSFVALNNVTVVNNTSDAAGGGLSNDGANIRINQSIISGNSGTGGTEIDSTGGTITVDNYNLFGLNSTAGVSGVTVGASDIVPTVATLAEIIDVNLADNGGLTPTHNLNSTGPAVDVVPNVFCHMTHDQTGKSRPIDGNADGFSDCDVGAVEYLEDIIFKDGFD